MVEKNFLIDYIRKIKEEFSLDEKGIELFNKIRNLKDKRRVYEQFCEIKRKYGLPFALISLYRQQVETGFVLGDPINRDEKEEKLLYDETTGITFIVQWNPDRELRKKRELLKRRGIIKEDIDDSLLINFDKNGKPCFLCRHNIEIQNPNEILVPVKILDELFYAGANFAYITNNHFTLMNENHTPQEYREKIPSLMNEFLNIVNGKFRIIYNGKAGASILEHEHFQITTEKFPVEDIKVEKRDIIFENDGIKIYFPYYYTPVFLIESYDIKDLEFFINRIIFFWNGIDDKNTENIVSVKSGEIYRNFIFLRNTDRLAGCGKKGAMASFEVSGNIVLSYKGSGEDVDERKTFDSADMETVKNLLMDISPDREDVRELLEYMKKEL